MQCVDVVELEPAILEMARRCCAINNDVLSHPKVHTIFNDAREVLLTTNERYDLIACEPSNPYRNGIANLFTREFYLAGRNRLNKGGMFLHFVQAYEIDERTMRTIFATFKSVFKHVEVWETQESDMLLVGSDRPPDYSLPKLRGKVAQQPFSSAIVNACHTHGVEGLLSHYVGGMALVDHFIGKGFVAINTDDKNQIEYGFARTVGHNDWSAAATLHRQSSEIGDHVPLVKDGSINRQTMRLDRQWSARCSGPARFFPTMTSPTQAEMSARIRHEPTRSAPTSIAQPISGRTIKSCSDSKRRIFRECCPPGNPFRILKRACQN